MPFVAYIANEHDAHDTAIIPQNLIHLCENVVCLQWISPTTRVFAIRFSGAEVMPFILHLSFDAHALGRIQSEPFPRKCASACLLVCLRNQTSSAYHRIRCALQSCPDCFRQSRGYHEHFRISERNCPLCKTILRVGSSRENSPCQFSQPPRLIKISMNASWFPRFR